MKKFMLLFCAFVALLGFVKFAVADGVKVDDDATCSDVDREQNQFSSGDTATLWINNPGTNATADYQYVITCNTKPSQSCTGCVLVSATRCAADSSTPFSEENYLHALIQLPVDVQAKCTIQVFENTTCVNNSTSGNPCNFGGTNVGSDSWTQN